MDENELLNRIVDDRDFVKEVLGVFQKEYPKHLSALREALADGDAGMIDTEAQSLKEITGNLMDIGP